MTYEYECTNCKFNWEQTQRITDPKITTCPSCKEEKAQRLISAGTGFVLKGGGWASEGYSSK